MPPPNQSNNDSDNEREPIEFPFTSLYLRGLDLGFTTADLHVMDYPSLLWFIRAAAPSTPKKSKTKQGVRKATQADINTLLG